MAVHQFGGKADVVGHDGTQPAFVQFVVRWTGENDAETALGEKRLPEREVLVHAQAARDADDGRVVGDGQVVSAEQQPVLFGEHVDAFPGTLGAVGIDLLAVVARKKGVAVLEMEQPDGAVVLAARTHLNLRLVLVGLN